jgi:uncharacterized membrane protein
MVGNVFAVIMPGQRKLVAALESGGDVDPRWGARAKLRSTHNTYLTLPLLFIMISNHYPMTYGHALNWLVFADHRAHHGRRGSISCCGIRTSTAR